MAVSTIGSRTVGIIYPLLALTVISASPMQIGLVTFALTVPGLLFYMPAGLLADRVDPRSIMLFTEAGRAFAIATVLLAILLDDVTITHIIIAAFLEGGFGVTYSLAETALLARLIPRDSMNSRLVASESGVHFAVLAGRPLGGLLYHFGAPVALAVNALLFLCSTGFLSAISRRRRNHEPRATSFRQLMAGMRSLSYQRLLGEIRSGIQELRRHRFMKHAIFATTTTNLAINTVIIIFMAGSANLSPILVGIILSAGGFGGAIGSNLARFPWVQKRIKPGTTALVTQMWIWVFALMITTLTDPMYYGLATLVTGCTGSLMNVSIRMYELREVERSMLGRVVSVHRLASHAAVCVAAPLGGWLASVQTSGEATRFILAFTIAAAVCASVAMPRWRQLLTPAR
ncbi:MFS transporter [Herbidospora daliensis]|uniref:MFS transporter n=1 Tax=Herbidospora daliensis TaxID=295585 RepID=UPI000780648E|nr:MFS transporter [Herbidospora daliensis]